MTEEFLYHIWKYKLFNLSNLKTTFGESIRIQSVGKRNHESGPDFMEARIQIADVLWIGLVEIHVNASDWWRHKHQFDPLYKKVILHVVWNYDKDVFDCNHNKIPVLELKGRVSKALISTFYKKENHENHFVCSGLTHHLDDFQTQNWLSRLLMDRLEKKVKIIEQVYQHYKGDWSQTFYIMLLKNLGFKVNALPMQLLGQNVSFRILLKSRNNLERLESILLGVGGFLEGKMKDEYSYRLQKEFKHQKRKFDLIELDKSLWKWGRVRPGNFPQIRLVQLAMIIFNHGDLFQKFVRDFNVDMNSEELNVAASEYWNLHYVLGESSHEKEKKLGGSSTHNILINTVAPMLFFYGKEMGAQFYREMAIELLERLPGENNSIIKAWEQNNIFASQASMGQALIELTHTYCEKKKCLECGIGLQILKHGA